MTIFHDTVLEDFTEKFNAVKDKYLKDNTLQLRVAMAAGLNAASQVALGNFDESVVGDTLEHCHHEDIVIDDEPYAVWVDSDSFGVESGVNRPQLIFTLAIDGHETLGTLYAELVVTGRTLSLSDVLKTADGT